MSTQVQNIDNSRNDGKLLLTDVFRRIEQLSNKERYLKTIQLAVKEQKDELDFIEFIELMTCRKLNELAAKNVG